MKTICILIFSLFTSPLFAKGSLSIKGYAIATTKNATMGVAYVEIKNTTKNNIDLVSASSSHAKFTEFHTHKKMGDLMKMEQVKSITIKSGETIKMEPGGLHLMLIQLEKPLLENKKLSVKLIDKNRNTYSGTLKIQKR